MAGFHFTRDDRTFLRECGIDPEPTVVDGMVDVLSRPEQYEPPTFIIPATLARDIMREYGELNWQTFTAYRTGRSNGKNTGKQDGA